MISQAQAEDILARYKRYDRAAERFDKRRHSRGGGWTEAEQAEIARMAGGSLPSNEELGELEFFNFMTQRPETIFAYYEGDARVGQEIRTWPGQKIGVVVWRGTETRPMGGRSVSIRMQGLNGFLYAGRCNLSSGSYCRLRKMSGRTR